MHNKEGSDIGFSVSYHTINEPALWSLRFGSCGGNVTTPHGILTSPSFPSNYQNDIECNYMISQQNGTFINITFHDGFNISCGDYIEMWDGDSTDSTKMAKVCGNGDVFPPYLLTSQNHLKIRYDNNLPLKRAKK